MSTNEFKTVVRLGMLFEKRYHLSRKEIEERFHISPRTVYRYIAILRKDFNAPIVHYWDSNRCRYFCSPGWKMMDALENSQSTATISQ